MKIVNTNVNFRNQAINICNVNIKFDENCVSEELKKELVDEIIKIHGNTYKILGDQEEGVEKDIKDDVELNELKEKNIQLEKALKESLVKIGDLNQSLSLSAIENEKLMKDIKELSTSNEFLISEKGEGNSDEPNTIGIKLTDEDCEIMYRTIKSGKGELVDAAKKAFPDVKEDWDKMNHKELSIYIIKDILK